MLSATEVVREFEGRAVTTIEPERFQEAVAGAAPIWGRSAWLHKYLHLNCPNLVTWSATPAWLASQLYSVGVAPVATDLYARDIQIVRFWNGLPALREVPAQLRYRAGKEISPREHWCLGLEGEAGGCEEMLIAGCLSLGPEKIGDLSEVMALNKKRDIQMAVETAFQTAGIDPKSDDAKNLTEFAYRLKDGSIVALLGDASTVVAVGEVIGSYEYLEGASRPHRLSVRWLHRSEFATSVPVEAGMSLLRLDSTHPVVAEIEASLLVNGIAPWKNFSAPDADLTEQRVANATSAAESNIFAQLPALEGITREVVDMLERKGQVILYGPPGTGKSYHAGRIAVEVVARDNFRCLPSQLSVQQRDVIYGRGGEAPYIAMCTFHPMYFYEDFIEGYRPDGAGFHLEPGIFKRMAIAAQAKPNKQFVLIIDEINRGNIPKIFGELITLIEASKRGLVFNHLPLSKEQFGVPKNLLIIGTMNTADRSILLLDTALRRRFAFKELLPEPHLLRSSSIGDISLSTWLRALNRRIVEQLGPDGRNLQVGHAYLMHAGRPVRRLNRISSIVRDELWPLLQEYCYEDANKLANILAADHGGIYDRKATNLRFELFEPGQEELLVQALIAIVTPEDEQEDALIQLDVFDDEDAQEHPKVVST